MFKAALVMLRLAAWAKKADRSVLRVLDELETTHGVHLTSQLTLRTAQPARRPCLVLLLLLTWRSASLRTPGRARQQCGAPLCGAGHGARTP